MLALSIGHSAVSTKTPDCFSIRLKQMWNLINMSGLESCPCPLFICFAFSLASADSPFSDTLRFTFGHVQQDDRDDCCTSTML